MTDNDTVWIRTVPDVDGTFRAVLEIDADTSHPLDPEAAMVHARAVLTAIAHAEYDAAVCAQLAGGKDLAGQVVVRLRDDRPPIVWPSPLQLVPGVSAFTGEPFLHVRIGGKTVGQWDIPDARAHALGMLESVIVADLDGGYLRWLRALDVPEEKARAIVANLGSHRKDQT